MLPEINESECVTPSNNAKHIRRPQFSMNRSGSFRYLVDDHGAYNIRSSVPSKYPRYDTEDIFMKYSLGMRRFALLFGSMLIDRLDKAMEKIKSNAEPNKLQWRKFDISVEGQSMRSSNRTINSFSANTPILRKSKFDDYR